MKYRLNFSESYLSDFNFWAIYVTVVLLIQYVACTRVHPSFHLRSFWRAKSNKSWYHEWIESHVFSFKYLGRNRSTYLWREFEIVFSKWKEDIFKRKQDEFYPKPRKQESGIMGSFSLSREWLIRTALLKMFARQLI